MGDFKGAVISAISINFKTAALQNLGIRRIVRQPFEIHRFKLKKRGNKI